MTEDLVCDYKYKCLEGIDCPHFNKCELASKIAIKITRYQHYSFRADFRQVFSIALRYGFRCPYCGKEMTFDRGYTNSLTLDHVKARSLGGSKGNAKNMVLCCNECNTKKSAVELRICSRRKRNDC